jgi:hypothetical protein
MKIAGSNFPDEAGCFHLKEIVGQDRRVEKKSFCGRGVPIFFQASVTFWHATCDKDGMARKINSMKKAQEARGQAAPANHAPASPTATLYLAQLQPRVPKAPPPVPRQQIAIQIEEPPQVLRMVKIIHTDSI